MLVIIILPENKLLSQTTVVLLSQSAAVLICTWQNEDFEVTVCIDDHICVSIDEHFNFAIMPFTVAF